MCTIESEGTAFPLNFCERLLSEGGVKSEIRVFIHELFYDDTMTQMLVAMYFIYFCNCHLDINKILVDIIIINYHLYLYESVG